MSLFGRKSPWLTFVIGGLRVRWNEKRVEISSRTALMAECPLPQNCTTPSTCAEFAVQQGYEFYKRRLAEYKSEAAELGYTINEEA